MNRKNICKITVGSHLYGTSGPQSDEDYYGVFLPSRADVLGLKPYPGEYSESIKISEGQRNTSGDIDCKYFSLAKFFTLAAEGQPGQLELLFAQDFHHAIPPTEEWQEIVRQRSLFLSQRAIVPFIGFAQAQAHKAVIKGENLDKIQRILAWSQTTESKILGQSIRETLAREGAIGPVPFSIFKNPSGAELIEISGRSFDIATPLKRFVDVLTQLEKKYGQRSRQASLVGVDWKSIHHAFRLTFEAEELLLNGTITLPFTGERLDFLKKLKVGGLPDLDWAAELAKRIDELQALVPSSHLPEAPDLEAVEEFHRKILGGYLEL